MRTDGEPTPVAGPGSTGRVRRRLVVRGIVQGVGFRPAVYRCAVGRGLDGFVGNDGSGVFVEVEGDEAAVDAFAEALPGAAPPLAVVDAIEARPVPPTGTTGFRIIETLDDGDVATSLGPDVAPCPACLRELADPSGRRYRYPFLNCTDCGPRYSIVARLPYDRASTTMATFPMCAECAAEYGDPLDRRYHAQPTCCPSCGPSLAIHDADFAPTGATDPLAEAVALLRRGAVVAVKGLGGYHLAVDAVDRRAVDRLRRRKHREDKPLAVLVADLDAARRLVVLGDTETDLLVSPERPVVLAERRHAGTAGTDVAASVAPSVAPGNRALGVLLPPTPLHVLIAQDFGGPLVLTSGNRSAEPIVHRDDDARRRLGGVADAYLVHDRPIQVRLDDSVTRVVGDRQIVVRRARGHAPRPVHLKGGFPRHTLACGAQLKATVCVGRDERAIVSQHLGDLDDHATRLAFEEAVEHLCRLFDVRPEVVAHDLHPDLGSSSFARSLDGVETVEVQHHHAHIASCLADNEVDDAVIGVAFDGLGLGADGTIWGGEILLADLDTFDRLGHLATVPMPGGDAAVRQPWRMAAVHASRALDLDRLRTLSVFERNHDRWDAVLSMAGAGVNAPLTSSAGRLFDAVAALVGVRDEVSYEGQAAIELEQAAALGETGTYPVELVEGTPFVLDTVPLLRAVADDVAAGAGAGTVSARFHNGVTAMVVAACEEARSLTGAGVVALSGGVWQNALLVDRVSAGLSGVGFRVLTHRRFPPNDGGISLGQAAVVAARDRYVAW